MWELLRNVRWLRVLVYSIGISAVTLNAIGGYYVKQLLAQPRARASILVAPAVHVAASGHSRPIKPYDLNLVAPVKPSVSIDTKKHNQNEDSSLLGAALSSKMESKEERPPKKKKARQDVSGGKHMKNSIECDNVVYAADPAQDIHVVYASDPREYIAMVTSANSAILNAKNADRLRFHFIIPSENNPVELCDLVFRYAHAYPGIMCANSSLLEHSNAPPCGAGQESGEEKHHQAWYCLKGPMAAAGGVQSGEEKHHQACYCGSPQFHILPFKAENYEVLAHTTTSHQDRKELLMGVNFARNFMDDLLLPWGVRRAIYMDVDTIVQGNLGELWDVQLKNGRYFGAVQCCYLHMSFWFDFGVDVVKRTMTPHDCYINAGVYIVDLDKYQEHRTQERIADLIVQHQKSHIWKLGVHQSSFILALYNYTQPIDAKWNLLQLGWNQALQSEKLKEAKILHWNGQKKPWKPEGLYKDRWRPYAIDGIGTN
ncbi:hypothetical protein CYMTET_38413 [Cymbomonas tetramitiformis]|uniref:Hexosyltransferase n=1 Tax=Cymbomonas tetramitiformis TaxID=36881 RepID=A0AAE0CC24_9CHLO|nr:hypothetical protein CYMTET_38413 [Cymbomonas tetramitiformis]